MTEREEFVSGYLRKPLRTEEQAAEDIRNSPRWRPTLEGWRRDLQRMDEGTYTPPPINSKLSGITPEAIKKRMERHND